MDKKKHTEMDTKKFEKKVKEYMLLSKRTLAELLAVREMDDEDTCVDMGTVTVSSQTIGVCPATGQWCNGKDCIECLFNEKRKELENKLLDENRMFLVDPRNLPRYTTTHTGNITGGTVTTTSTCTDPFRC